MFLPVFPFRLVESVGTGKGLQHQPRHGLQVHWTLGNIKRQGAEFGTLFCDFSQ